MKCTLVILQESDFYKHELGEHSFYYELETENGKLMVHYNANVNLDSLKQDLEKHGCINMSAN